MMGGRNPDHSAAVAAFITVEYDSDNSGIKRQLKSSTVTGRDKHIVAVRTCMHGVTKKRRCSSRCMPTNEEDSGVESQQSLPATWWQYKRSNEQPGAT